MKLHAPYTQILLMASMIHALVSCNPASYEVVSGSKKQDPQSSQADQLTSPHQGESVTFFFEGTPGHVATGAPIRLKAFCNTLMPHSIDWDMGDGSTAQGNEATHVYSLIGTYIVKGTCRLHGRDIKLTAAASFTVTSPYQPNQHDPRQMIFH